MIRIAHLYYDLMNLYGDNGNIKAIKYQLENQGIKTIVDFLTIGDNIDFDKYDLLYLGPGTYDNQKIILKDLMKYQKNIKRFIDEDKFVIATGNALELFGKSIKPLNGKNIKALNIFDFESEETELRLVGETVATCNSLKKEVIGFQNQNSIITKLKNPWFELSKGIGSNVNSNIEGINCKNFYGTYMIGPILVRNSELLELICKKLILQKNKDFKFKSFNVTLENKAYNEYIKNYLTKKV